MCRSSERVRPAFAAIAFEIGRLERRAGATFGTDRALAFAAGEAAKEIIDLTTPIPNEEAINVAVDAASEVMDAIERKTAYLLDVGAVGYANALLPQRPILKNVPERWHDAATLLMSRKLILTIDLTQPPESWDLKRDGKAVPVVETAAVFGSLDALTELSHKFRAAVSKIDEARADEIAAEKKGKSLMRPTETPSNVG